MRLFLLLLTLTFSACTDTLLTEVAPGAAHSTAAPATVRLVGAPSLTRSLNSPVDLFFASLELPTGGVLRATHTSADGAEQLVLESHQRPDGRYELRLYGMAEAVRGIVELRDGSRAEWPVVQSKGRDYYLLGTTRQPQSYHVETVCDAEGDCWDDLVKDFHQGGPSELVVAQGGPVYHDVALAGFAVQRDGPALEQVTLTGYNHLVLVR